MKEIPEFKLNHIIEIEEKTKRTYHLIENEIKKSPEEERTCSFYLDLESFSRDLSKIEEISDSYIPVDDFIVTALEKNLDSKFNFEYDGLNGTIELKQKEPIGIYIHKFIREINLCIKKQIENDLGVDFSKYYKEKNDEKQNELLIDYENGVRKVFQKLLLEKVGVKSYNLILKSDAQLSHYDLKNNELEQKEHSSFKLKIQQTNSAHSEYNLNQPLYEKIRSNNFVDFLEFPQRNNNRLVIIITTKEAKDLVAALALEASNIYHNSPRYKEPNNDELTTFIFRVNDNKGNDCDIVKLKSNGDFLVLIKDEEYMTLSKLKTENKELYNIVNKELNTLSKEQQPKKRKTNKP